MLIFGWSLPDRKVFLQDFFVIVENTRAWKTMDKILSVRRFKSVGEINWLSSKSKRFIQHEPIWFA